jgi:hypothetical protein
MPTRRRRAITWVCGSRTGHHLPGGIQPLAAQAFFCSVHLQPLDAACWDEDGQTTLF